MFTIQIQAEPIALDAGHGAHAERDDCGAEVRFIGKVRNDARSAAITHLTLEHFPGVTESEIKRIVDQARERWSLQNARVVHRVGPIAVGETIVLVETASAHRRDAYEANVFIMDYLKTEAPFWKQECFADGTELWVEAKSTDQQAAQRWESEVPQGLTEKGGTDANSHATGPDAAQRNDSGKLAAPRLRIGALILAGGEARRMEGRNKGLQRLRGKPMVEHVLDVLKPHVEYAAISANSDLEEYQGLGVPVFTDNPRLPVGGPLAGIMAAVPQFPGSLDAVMVVPCDMPMLPQDLVPRLAAALSEARAVAVLAQTSAAGSDGHHGVFLCRSGALPSLIHYVTERVDQSLMGWLLQHPCETVYFENAEAFQNVNDLATLQRLQRDHEQRKRHV